MLASFFAKYWVELIFSLILGAITWFVRRYIKLEKERAEQERTQFKALLMEEIEKKNRAHTQEDNSIREDISRLKKGVLSFQGRMFKDHCRSLLESGRDIGLEEFEEVEGEHDAYNGLGGNHEGDVLYNLVKRKVENEIARRHGQ